jgi:cobalt-zinc-cadmium resistance protein CzcA
MVPALASMLLTGRTKDRDPWIMRQVEKVYRPVLNVALRFRRTTVALGLASTVIGILLFSSLGGEFLPQLDEGTLLVQCTRAVDISIDKSVALQARTEEIIAQYPEVAYTFSKLGTSEIANDPMGVHQADLYVVFKDEKNFPLVDGKHRTRHALAQLMIENIDKELGNEQSVLLSQPIQMRFNDLLEGSKADVSVKLFGDDMDLLSKLTHQIADIIGTIPRKAEIETELQGTSSLLRITPDAQQLRTLGLSSNDVLQSIGIGLGGKQTGFLYDGLKRFPVIVRLAENDRSDLDALKELPVGVSTNTTMPLKKLAKLEFIEAYGSVTREQGKRRAAVLINPNGRDVEGFVREAQRAVEAQVTLPVGYYLEWGGTFRNVQVARSRLAVLAPLALLLVLMMIYAAFKSVAQTALIFVCIPLALMGGVLGLILNDIQFSITAGVGFIALSGIAVLNGVVLVNYFNELQRQGVQGDELVRQGTLLRLRPVLMTALVDIFGFLPMMLSQGVGAEVQKPLASVVIGGIVSSTILTLVLLPALYSLFAKNFETSITSPDANE